MTTDYDIIAIQGVDLVLQFTAIDAVSGIVDLTNYNASGVVRNKYSDTGILLDLHPVVDPSYTGGLININIPASGLANLPVTEAVYDIKIYNLVSGYVKQVVRGYFEINPATTL